MSQDPLNTPIFCGMDYVKTYDRNTLVAAYKLLNMSYQILLEMQTTGPKSVAELKQKIEENTVNLNKVIQTASEETTNKIKQFDEQEKSLPDLLQMFEIAQKQITESVLRLKAQAKVQKEENQKLKEMYKKVQSSQEEEFEGLSEEASKPLEERLEVLQKEKEKIAEEVGGLKEQSQHKEDLAKVEEEFKQIKEKLENDTKDVQQKINDKNAEIQKVQGDVDKTQTEIKAKDVQIQKLNSDMIQKDIEIKKLRAEIEGKIVDSYAL